MTATEQNQAVNLEAKHAFRWSGNGKFATCSCQGWTLWGATQPSAKVSHHLHLQRQAELA